jgi:membrane protease YdiL (CAAX protease family)
MRFVAFVFVVTAAALGFAFRPELAGTATFWLALVGAYAVVAALALYRMWDDGSLFDVLKPRWGDLSIGALVAAVLLVGSWAARSVLAPAGTPRQGWLLRIYLQLGDAETVQRSALLTAAVLVIPLLDELAWRGLVLPVLSERFGTRRGWPLAALLYGLAAVPTVFGLSDPEAGPNPLLVIAAIGCGLFWSFIASIMRRLPPVMISHAAFSYFTITQFRWPGM